MSGDFDSTFDSSFDVSADLPFFDYAEHAVSRLPHQYRSGDPANPTNTEKALRALLAPANALGTAMRAVLTQRNIDTAVGVQLTVIGALVGRKDRVADDEIERRFCRATIAANKSDGTRNDVLAVARAVIGAGGTVVATNFGNGAAIYRVEGVTVTEDVADVLAELIGKAASGGVRAIISYTTGPVASRAHWGTGTWSTTQNWSRARNTEQ